MGRLDRRRDDPKQLAAEGLEVDLVAHAAAERVDRAWASYPDR